MKNLIFFIILNFFSDVFSQEINRDYKYVFELEKSQESSWNLIEQEWRDTVYFPYISKLKIKISDCQKCGNFYIDFEGTIDNNGTIKIDAQYSKKCGKKMTKDLESKLLDFFLKKKFPENLRNLKIQHRLGMVYKC